MAKILFATTAAGVKFYPVTITDAVVHIKGNTQTKLSELLDAIDYSGKADKVSGATANNFAGLDSNGNLTDSGYSSSSFEAAGSIATEIAKLDAEKTQSAGADGLALSITEVDGKITAISGSIAANTYDAYGAAADVLGDSNDTSTDNTVYGAKAYADSLASNYEAAGAVNTAIAALDASESQTAGADGLALSITEVDGVITAISGSIAAGTYDAAGAAAAVLGSNSDAASANTVFGAKAYSDSNKSDVIGTSSDAASADTINGAKAYADAAVQTAMTSIAGALVYKGTVNSNSDLPSTGNTTGDTYAVATAGTYASKACEVGDYLIWNGSSWDAVSGENQVSNEAASLVIGTATTIATVDGTDITVTQVEDMTKIEAVAVADTTDYADVTSLFTAPAQGE